MDVRAACRRPELVMTTHITHSEEETIALARDLASTLQPGAVLLLSGNLGAGKTAFVRGLAEGLGIDPAEVSSPTFALVHEYRGGRLTLFHVDLYRLEQAATEDLGLEEMAAAGSVTAIEWPERLRRSMTGAMTVEMAVVSDTTREITVR